MSDFSSHIYELLPVDQAIMVNRACDSFEREWSSGKEPCIESHLSLVAPAIRRVLLHELIVIDATFRRRLDHNFDPQRYSAFPDLDEQWLRERAFLVPTKPTSGDRTEPRPALPRYEVVREIGRGGMGIVYQARDRRLGRLVCLKSLPWTADRNPERMTRFQREALVVSSLNHPNICTIHELEEHEGRPYLVLEWIEGTTFRTVIREQVSLSMAPQLVEQAARALTAAHAAGVLHRDIKPENLMVRPDGLVKVLDFGLARLVEPNQPSFAGTGSLTTEGALIGTANYMSPEQARGETTTPSSDIFSLGIVLYELATGRHPFPGGHLPAVLHAIVEAEPTPACVVNSAIDYRLGTLISRMLDKAPDRRPTAAEVVDSLHALATGAADSSHSLVIPGSLSRTGLVGRDREIAAIHAACSTAMANKGNAIFVAGEPGIGKTSLVEHCIEHVARPSGFLILHGRCSHRLSSADAYLPLLDALGRLAEGPDRTLVQDVLTTTSPAWRALTTSSTDAVARMSAEGEQLTSSRLKREFRALVDGLSRRRPVLVFLDDLHWSDEATIDLLAYLGNDLPTRVVILGAYRPSDAALGNPAFERMRRDLVSRGRCRELAASFLTREDVGQLLERRYPAHRFPDSYADFLIGRTEGNPLFLMGLVRFLEDRGIVASIDDHWTVTQDPQSLGRDLPDSIASLIECTLSRISVDDRQLLQVASVQGVEFHGAVVADALRLDRVDVEDRLQRIEQTTGLIQNGDETEFPDGTLTLRHRFIHVLFHEALYSATTPARRAAWSLDVAQVLTTLYGRRRQEIALTLAFLYEAGRDASRAVECLLAAAQHDVVIGACQEAAAASRRGIRLLERLPPSPQRDHSELLLQYSYGFAASFSRGYGDPETFDAYQRAEELCLREPISAELFSVLHGLWVYHLVRMDAASLVHVSTRIVHLAKELGVPQFEFAAMANHGVALLHQGELLPATAAFEHAWQIPDYTIDDDRRFIERMCVPFGLLCRGICSWLWHLIGRPDGANLLIQKSIEDGEAIQVPQFRVQSWHFAAILSYLRRDPTSALRWAEQTTEFAQRHDLEFYYALGSVVRVWADVELSTAALSTLAESLAAAKGILAVQQERGIRLAAPIQMCMVGEALAKLGHRDEARSALEDALSLGRETGERWWEAEILRQQGRLWETAYSDSKAAAGLFADGADLARRQGAVMLEIRILTDWLRLVDDPAIRDKRRQRLRELLDTTREGHSTADFVAAEAVVRGRA